MITNLSAKYEDTRLISNMGLTIGNEKNGGVGLRGKVSFALLETI